MPQTFTQGALWAPTLGNTITPGDPQTRPERAASFEPSKDVFVLHGTMTRAFSTHLGETDDISLRNLNLKVEQFLFSISN